MFVKVFVLRFTSSLSVFGFGRVVSVLSVEAGKYG